MYAALPATQSDPATQRDTDEAVERFLRANPGWLAQRPDLYGALTPPIRIHGEALADHMAAMVARERRHAGTMAERSAALLAAGRNAATIAGRVHDAVIALIAAPDAPECIATEFPRLLAMDAAVWCRRQGGSPIDHHTARLEQEMGGEDLLFRAAPPDAADLYREAASLARHDLLIRLPALGVLALASRHPIHAALRFARPQLIFLGAAIAALAAARPARSPPSPAQRAIPDQPDPE